MATIPQDILPPHLPFVPAPSAPNSALPTLSPGAPLQMDAQSKSRNGQGVKQASAGKQAMIKQNPFVGDASRQVISSRTAQCHHTAPNVGKKATFWLNVPKRTKGLVYYNHPQDNPKLQWTHSFLTLLINNPA